MSAGKDVADVLNRFADSSPQQRVLRATVLVGTVAFLALVSVSGGELHPILGIAALLLGLLVTVVPESHAPVGLLLYLGLMWVFTSSGHLDGWLLLATADLLAMHLACALVAYGPAGHTVDRELLRRWGRRYAVCLTAALGVWVVAVSVRFLDLPGSGLVLGTALLVLLGWVGYLNLRLARPDVSRDA